MKIKTKLISSVAALAAIVSVSCIGVSASYYDCTTTVDSKGYNVALNSTNECFLVDTSEAGNLNLSYVQSEAGDYYSWFQQGTYENVYARTPNSGLTATLNVSASFVDKNTGNNCLKDIQNNITVGSAGATISDKSSLGSTPGYGNVLIECKHIQQKDGTRSGTYKDLDVNTYVLYVYGLN